MEIHLRRMSVYSSAVSDVKYAAMVPEVSHALMAWIKAKLPANESGVLIGGLAMSFYARPRETTDVDLLFLRKSDIPEQVAGFKRYRPGAFRENTTHVDIEVTTPDSFDLPQAVVDKVFDTAILHDGIRVASREAMVVLKLYGADTPRREFKDLADIVAILEVQPVNLSAWTSLLKPHHLSKFADAKVRAVS